MARSGGQGKGTRRLEGKEPLRKAIFPLAEGWIAQIRIGP
jgi:hypothetical protein